VYLRSTRRTWLTLVPVDESIDVCLLRRADGPPCGERPDGLRDGLASTFGDVGVPGAAAAAAVGARPVLVFEGVVLEAEA
jgi:hypothetical protein